MKNLFLFPVLLLGIFSFSKAQSNIEKGYIITLKNDTVPEMILYLNGSQYTSCLILKENYTKYKPDEIKGYGIIDGAQYTSGILDRFFVEILVLGELSLYKKDDFFIVKRENGDLIFLNSYYIEVELNGRDTPKKGGLWKDHLSYLFFDCLDVKNMSFLFSKEVFIKQIRAYNECKGAISE